MMHNMERDIADERLAQKVLRLLAGEPVSTEELAARLGLDPVETLVLLRHLGQRVVNVTSFADRQQKREVWVAGETPLTTG